MLGKLVTYTPVQIEVAGRSNVRVQGIDHQVEVAAARGDQPVRAPFVDAASRQRRRIEEAQ